MLYIYGPEGCGKTRLLRELHSRLVERNDFLVVYIDASEAVSVEDAIEAVHDVVRAIVEFAGEAGEPPGRVVAALLPKILKKL